MSFQHAQLKNEQLRYLMEQPDLPSRVRTALGASPGEVIHSKDLRDELMEYLGTLLQRKGFDAEWAPTADGRLVEDILDLLREPNR